MASKMAVMMMMTVAMVVFSLASMPSPSAATRFVDPAKLLAALDIPTGKNEESNWCQSCSLCGLSYPPRCICSDLTDCSKCVCARTVGDDLKEVCETIFPKFSSFCIIPDTTMKKTLASLI